MTKSQTIFTTYASVAIGLAIYLMRDTLNSPEAVESTKRWLALDAFWAILWPIILPFVAFVYFFSGKSEYTNKNMSSNWNNYK